MREVVRYRLVPLLAGTAGAVGLVWIGWKGASTNSATPVNRMYRYFPVVGGVWVMEAGFLLILAGYVVGLLVLTARRVRCADRVLPLAVARRPCRRHRVVRAADQRPTTAARR